MTDFASTLNSHRYLNIETFRRNGAGVKTPVWFVVHNGALCFSAPAHTWKVKRLAHTKSARVAPCDERGALLGEWVDVVAEHVTHEEAEEAHRLLKQKYGWQWVLLELFGKLRRWRYVVCRIAQTGAST